MKLAHDQSALDVPKVVKSFVGLTIIELLILWCINFVSLPLDQLGMATFLASIGACSVSNIVICFAFNDLYEHANRRDAVLIFLVEWLVAYATFCAVNSLVYATDFFAYFIGFGMAFLIYWPINIALFLIGYIIIFVVWS